MGLFRKSKKEIVEHTSEENIEVEETTQEAVKKGPFDANDIEETEGLVDCGALRIPVVPGYDIQFTLERSREIVLGVVYVGADSAIQLQAFAAPTSANIWDDVRADMIASIAAQGGSSREADGEYGKEIRAQMPIEGSKAVNPVRYVGIDGPRWLLRITLTGKAAVDDKAAAAALHDVLDTLVVDRGNEAHPPREILPMSVPRSPRSSEKDEALPTLSLPARGPEISEVR